MKTFYYAITFLLLCMSVNSQSWAWGKRNPGGGEGNSVCTDINGDIYLVGGIDPGISSFGTYTLNGNSTLNACIVKYDPSGNVIWGWVHDNDLAQGLSVFSDLNGNVFVTGSFSTTIVFGSFTLTSLGDLDIFIAKYDSNGNVLWAKSAGGVASDSGYGVTTDPAGNCIFVGYFQSASVAFGVDTLYSTGGQNMFIAKYDLNGNPLWATQGNSYDLNLARSVSADPNGNIFVTGSYNWSYINFGANVLYNSGNNFDYFLVKYDPSGNAIWARSCLGLGDDEAFAVSADQYGNAYVGGFFGSTTFSIGTSTFTNTGIDNMFITKYDSSGNNLWAKVSSGYANFGFGVSSYSAGVFVVGGIKGPNMTVGNYTFTPLSYSPNGNDAMFITSYDINGNLTYGSFLEGGGDDLVGVTVDKFCNTYIGGDLETYTVIIGTDSLYSSGGSEELFLAKLNLGTFPIAITRTPPVCAGQSVALTASGANNYQWYNGPATNTLAVSPSVNTTYTVTASLAGCSNKAAYTVSVISTPTLNLMVADSMLCFGNTTQIIATGANTYSWSAGLGTNQSILVSPMITTIYTVTGANAGCFGTATLQITVNVCTGIKQNSYQPEILSLYPNPNSGSFKLDLDNGECCLELSVYDNLGQVIHKQSLIGGINEIHIASPLKGIYSYVLENNKQAMTRLGKLIVE